VVEDVIGFFPLILFFFFTDYVSNICLLCNDINICITLHSKSQIYFYSASEYIYTHVHVYSYTDVHIKHPYHFSVKGKTRNNFVHISYLTVGVLLIRKKGLVAIVLATAYAT